MTASSLLIEELGPGLALLIDDVRSDLTPHTISILSRAGVLDKVIGYMAECRLCNIPMFPGLALSRLGAWHLVHAILNQEPYLEVSHAEAARLEAAVATCNGFATEKVLQTAG